jgi:outer membrane protein OmpA-like peptidoglycan-associated protein
VDAKGCPLPEEAKELLDTGSLIMRDIQFETNSATLKPTSYPALEKVGQILAAWPQLELEVAGYTDDTGNADYNKELSLKRAQAVADYIRNLYPAIGADQMKVAGYGEDFPIATNETAEGRAKNRRVEFKVLSQGTLEKK